MIRVAIVEDNGDLRSLFRRMVEETEDFACAGDFSSGEEALAQLPGTDPEVVLMDIQLTGMNGVECVRRLKAALPRAEIVMFTVFEHSDWIFDSLQSGASGYLLKRASRQEIVAAIRQAYEGGAPMSTSVARKVVQYFGKRRERDAVEAGELNRLTEREHDVLAKLSEGLSYDEIGSELAISINTVRKHIRGIYTKLAVNSRTEAVTKLLRQ
jgi:DNA-binding NarL/FixJ family response regulator